MPIAFQNTFAGSSLDRAGTRRGDRDWLALQLADPQALALTLWKNKFLADAAGLVRRPLAGLGNFAPNAENLMFLGLDGAVPVFAIAAEGEEPPPVPASTGAFEELRPLAMRLSADEASQAAAARSILDWHRRHRWCAFCGNQTQVGDAGWRRICPNCKTEHYPRTDPVAIMLPVFGDKCLLGRQASWDPGRWSALAGFVEPGESIEEAVARELFEEASLTAVATRYHSSQPWPFPGQMMVGFIVEVADDQAVADVTELEAIRWFTRAELGALLRGEIEAASAPPPIAIAHQLLRAWVAEG